MLAPPEIVRDFLNTLDLEADTDELASPAELAVWLREHRLIGPPDRATDDDLVTALALREGLRAALRGEAADLPVLPLRVAMSGRNGTPRPGTLRSRTAQPSAARSGTPPPDAARGGTPELVAVEGGVRGGLAVIAAAVTGRSWDRLKVCAEITCQWAFIDASKNRSRSWCSMRVCGNRTKTRAYRARKQGSRRLQGSNTDTV
ncbi:CGNR zinc finger domain-containing protein [Nonomuraea lactucae]|uniref:CGNR zinc finger domain-containing protein n=1 Tax=Nonomuraea lactucae TaxID=2249762 RepID=UPI000DE22305|nr:CGNR zinc finger domain-containing protein [Nonomuraea lactucae]